MGQRTGAGLSAGRAGARDAALLAGLGIAVVLLALGALAIGQYPLPPGRVLALLFGGAGGDQAEIVLFGIRAPRVGAALLVGAALSAAGAAYQGMFRNPLVSPDILGVSSGAGLGAVLGIFLSLPVWAIQGMAFAGGLAAVGAVAMVAALVRGRDTVLVLVLAGVVIGALAGAATSLLKVMADPYDQLPAITFWLLGSLAGIKTGDVAAVLPAILIALLPMALLRWRINVMAMGDEEARAMGVDATRLRLGVIACATLMTASAVSVCGVVGWVGLVIPHIARMVVGPSFAVLLPASVLIGAGYMLIVDTLARSVTAAEVPLGILTAIIGAPVFIWLLARGRRGWV
jgi:iron complex transport system permease protein